MSHDQGHEQGHGQFEVGTMVCCVLWLLHYIYFDTGLSLSSQLGQISLQNCK